MRPLMLCVVLLVASAVAGQDPCIPGGTSTVNESVYVYACESPTIRLFDKNGNYLRTISIAPDKPRESEANAFRPGERFAAVVGAPSCIQGFPQPRGSGCAGMFDLRCPEGAAMYDVEVDMPDDVKVSVVRRLPGPTEKVFCTQKYTALSMGQTLEAVVAAERVDVTVAGLTKVPFTYVLNFATLHRGKVVEPPPEMFMRQKSPRGGTTLNGADAQVQTVQFTPRKRKN
jgi:hypothetical protein